MSLRLVSLRIPSGWKVAFNNFVEVGDVQTLSDRDRDAYLSQDLLSLEHREVVLDVGWHPDGDPSGAYALRLVRGSWDDVPIRFDHRSTAVIQQAIELVLAAVNRDADLASVQAVLDELQ